MSEAALTISFISPAAASADLGLKIEQEPWGKDVGKTSTIQTIAAIRHILNGSPMPTLNCGGANGMFRTRVFVYPADLETAFQFKLSNGLVISNAIEFPIREEIIHCGMMLEQTTDYPVHSIISGAWLGDCYDGNGARTTHPDVEIDGNKITFAKQVYGSVRLRYLVYRRVYVVQISKRETALENKYKCLAFCVYDGGVEWIDVEAPAGFEETGGACENGDIFKYMEDLKTWLNGRIGHVDICQHRYRTVPVAAYADQKIKVAFCPQEIVSDTTTENVDTETEEIECD